MRTEGYDDGTFTIRPCVGRNLLDVSPTDGGAGPAAAYVEDPLLLWAVAGRTAGRQASSLAGGLSRSRRGRACLQGTRHSDAMAGCDGWVSEVCLDGSVAWEITSQLHAHLHARGGRTAHSKTKRLDREIDNEVYQYPTDKEMVKPV